jgi:hypothetical protein
MESIRIHVVDMLPKGQTFTTRYDVSTILKPFMAWRQAQANRPERKLIVHVDYAKPHTAEVTLTFFE